MKSERTSLLELPTKNELAFGLECFKVTAEIIIIAFFELLVIRHRYIYVGLESGCEIYKVCFQTLLLTR